MATGGRAIPSVEGAAAVVFELLAAGAGAETAGAGVEAAGDGAGAGWAAAGDGEAVSCDDGFEQPASIRAPAAAAIHFNTALIFICRMTLLR